MDSDAEVTKLDWANVMNDFIISCNRTLGTRYPLINTEDPDVVESFVVPTNEDLCKYNSTFNVDMAEWFKTQVQKEANRRQERGSRNWMCFNWRLVIALLAAISIDIFLFYWIMFIIKTFSL